MSQCYISNVNCERKKMNEVKIEIRTEDLAKVVAQLYREGLVFKVTPLNNSYLITIMGF